MITTPFKIHDENDGIAVSQSSVKASRGLGGLASSTSTATSRKRVPEGSSPQKGSVLKSSRKALVDISHSQVNTRIFQTPSVQFANGTQKQLMKSTKAICTLNSRLKNVDGLEYSNPNAQFNNEDMVCSGWEIEEDPYDLVSRLSENSNRAIFEDSVFQEPDYDVNDNLMSFEIPSISLDYDDCINSTVEIHNPPALPAVDLNSINELH